MSNRELHVVVGAGIAGCVAAIMRRLAGYDVIILEKMKSDDSQVYPICTGTSAIVSENHSGAEYPYDAKSTVDCLDGRIENERFFPDFIYAGKTHTRIIASSSMVQAGDDIRERCRDTINTIKLHYKKRVEENDCNRVLGDPESICYEIEDFAGVEDTAAAFVTPQRGLNPVYVAALLEAEIKRLGIEFRQGYEVTGIEKQANGKLRIQGVNQWNQPETINADQVCVAAAGRGFQLSKMLRPQMNFPKTFFALRQISFVNVSRPCQKSYTCLKLEDQYGGMLSPLNETCVMIYHPPAAHMEIALLNPVSGEMPESLIQWLSNGHPESQERAEQTLDALTRFYPELKYAESLQSHLKIAINTTDISRMRRNMPVVQVVSGCTMIVLAKWTMAVVNAKEDLDFALNHSVQRGTLSQASKNDIIERMHGYTIPVPEAWKRNFSDFLEVASKHAKNMHLPGSIVSPMNIEHIESLQTK
jgi:glycine/D-amino acid oxidase-like deaminating enzyme